MSLVYTDGFFRSAANINRRMTQTVVGSGATTQSVSTTGGPFNGPYFRIGDGGPHANSTAGQRTVPYPAGSGATFIANFWINVATAFSENGSTNATAERCCVISCRQAGTPQANLRLNTSGTLSLNVNGAIVATSAAALHQATWHHIEWKHVLAASGGTSDLRIDGQAAAGFSFTGATRTTTSNTWDEFQIGNYGVNGSTLIIDVRYAGLIIMDGNSSTTGMNSFIGVTRLDLHVPTSDGHYVDFSLSTGSDHYALVDESQMNEDTDYAYTTTALNKDSYGHTALVVSGATMKAVMVWIEARREDAGVVGLKAGFRISGTDYKSSEQSPPLDYAELGFVFETDPSTSAAWTESAFNSAEVLQEKST